MTKPKRKSPRPSKPKPAGLISGAATHSKKPVTLPALPWLPQSGTVSDHDPEGRAT